MKMLRYLMLLVTMLSSSALPSSAFAQGGCVRTGTVHTFGPNGLSKFSARDETLSYLSGVCQYNTFSWACDTINVVRAGTDDSFGTTDDVLEILFLGSSIGVGVAVIDSHRIFITTIQSSYILDSGVDLTFGTTDDISTNLLNANAGIHGVKNDGVLTFSTATSSAFTVYYCDTALSSGPGACTAATKYSSVLPSIGPPLTNDILNVSGFAIGPYVGVALTHFYQNYDLVKTELALDGSSFINLLSSASTVNNPFFYFTEIFNGINVGIVRSINHFPQDYYIEPFSNMYTPIAPIMTFWPNGASVNTLPHVSVSSGRIVTGTTNSVGAQELSVKPLGGGPVVATLIAPDHIRSDDELYVGANDVGDTLVTFLTQLASTVEIVAYRCN